MPESDKGTNFLFCDYSALTFLHIIRLCFQLIKCPIKNKIDIAMLTCFTYFVKNSVYSWKTKFVKRANY